MSTHRHDPARTYASGEHAWHYCSTREGDSFRILVLRHLGPHQMPYCVCAMDTRSNPRAEQDADLICAALDAAGTSLTTHDGGPGAAPVTRTGD